MVQCVVKRTSKEDASSEFVYVTNCSVSTETLLTEIVEVCNQRQSVLRLAAAVAALAAHGPLRPEETRGIGDAQVAKMGGLDVHAYGLPTAQDEHFHRTGVPPMPEIAKILNSTAETAEREMNKKFPITVEEIKVQFGLLRGAVMIAYPAYHRLPVYDPAREELEHPMTADGSLNKADCSLWWAGKDVTANKDAVFADFVGKNEKSKIVLKLQLKSAGPPAREPRIDQATHQQMLAFYHQRQEEMKKLKQDDDDSYLASAWANPKSLKASIVNDGRDVSWRPQ